MTPRYTAALTFAAQAHEGQARKGTSIPYITHPVAVAALVARHDGDEDQQVAALLHDVLEDGGPQFAPLILDRFGPAVFDRFTAGRTGTLWYYDALARIFDARRIAMADTLTEAVARMQRLAK